MADVSGTPRMWSELVSCGDAGTGQSSMESLINEANHETVMREEQRQRNPEEEDDPEDQLALSQLFMNQALPSVSPFSLETDLHCIVTHPRRKRSKRLSCCCLGFNLKSFSIKVNHRLLNSEISYSERVEYFKLCCARKSRLHKGLIKTINCKLAAGIILETVRIADEIQDCSLSTSQTQTQTKLKVWGQTLAAFKDFGMEVDFLQERITQLLMLSNQYQECDEAGRHSEIINRENCLNKEIASLETKLAELKEAKMALLVERETIETHLQECNLAFEQIAKLPW